MKILIASDSHGNTAALKTAVEREKPDQVFHLGDMIADAGRLAAAFPGLPVECVLGNCDGRGDGTQQDRRILTVGKVKFLLTHGHRFHVKLGLGLLAGEGRSSGVDVVCFGHTHQAMCTRWTGGFWMVNPGTAGGVHAPATYAVAEVEDGNVSIELKEL